MQILSQIKTKLIQHFWIILILLSSFIIFSPALDNFFLGDDWFHLAVVQIDSFNEFLNFFNPYPNEQSIAFYRPLPTQVFFFVFNTLFGLEPFFYHLAMFLLFSLTTLLFYKTLVNYKLQENTALIATALFAFSHTHFTRLYFLSANQELFMSLFFILALLKNQNIKTIKDYVLLGLYFILGLLSKENALVLPAFIVIIDWLVHKKRIFKKYVFLGLIASIYILMRVFIVGFSMTTATTEEYTFNFSPRMAINTTYFYSLWTVGGAELLQDYMSSPISLIPRYATDYGALGNLMIALLISLIVIIGVIVCWHLKKAVQLISVFSLFFIISLLPVLFLPLHKFTIQMSVAVVSFSVFFALLIKNKPRILQFVALSLYIALNLVSISLTARSHYSVQRAEISAKVYTYLQAHYPQPPNDSYFYIINSDTAGSELATWGSSRQVSNALMGDNFFKVLYPDKKVTVQYEDDNPNGITDKQPLVLKSEWFLN